MKWKVPKIWAGGSCWIIGGGHSVPWMFDVPKNIIKGVCSGAMFPISYSEYLSPIHSAHVIGINNAYQLGSWIECLFFGDSSWFLVHQKRLANWPGLKVTCSPRFANGKRKGIKYLAKDSGHRRGISSHPGKLSWNSNSGAAAISLAVKFGVRRIFLLGFDMQKSGKYTHWHGSHGRSPKKLPYDHHKKGFGPIAQDAAKIGVEIFNVNDRSSVEEFPIISLAEALAFDA